LDNVDAIKKGLQDGTIDVIATDHAPHSDLEKILEFDLAANGIIVGITDGARHDTKIEENSQRISGRPPPFSRNE